ncbi:uncharacterized protein TrAFT101_010743 [Trichoderma asperellum]|uniref:uncharacterized protein n=1 Tax=Trichoderma asperellum TaxID=101201 RepID=UPI003325D881|nr:hypothetical protein TrAFT101_010743 [Trichoderma asperellum]
MQESAVDSTSNIDGRKLQCPECNRRFIRPEHMRRHLRNHDTSKRFACHVCSKKFARSDILSKHRAAHVAGPSQTPVQKHSNGFVPSKSRACYACAKAREKCSKGLPCMRCSRRGLACVYPGHQQHDKYDQLSIGGNNNAARQPNTENISATDLALTPGDISVNNHTLAALMFDGTHSKSENASSTSTGSCTTAIQNAPWVPIAACTISNNQLASISTSDHDPSGSVQQWPYRNNGLESGVEVSNQPINWLPFDELIESNLGSILDETIPLSQNDGAQWLFIDSSNATNGSPKGGSWNLDIPLLIDIDDEKSNGTSPNISKADFPPSKSTPSANYRRGDLYATSSNGARNACSTRAKRYGIFRKNEFPQTDHPRMNITTLNEQVGFQDVENMDVSDDGAYHPAMAISSFTYDIILQHFDEICLQTQLHMPCFGTKNFPSLPLLNLFVKLYFKCFDPILPFIHLPSLDMNKSWVLTVAIAAIGSHYCQSQELTECFPPLHEFCKVLLQQESERPQDEMTDLPMLQARILNHIGFCYSESEKLDSVVISIWSFNLSLVNSKSHEHLMRNRNDRVLESHDWDGWVMAESWRRLYFTTRVLHIMMIYHFNLRIDHGCGVAADFDLPQEKLWQARTHEDWMQLFLKTEGNPSLGEATNELFQTKSVKPELGEFSHCIILHELYNEIANITIYHSRKLALWTPTSESTSIFPVSSSESLGSGDRKLTVLGHSVQHSNATSDWRNAALDCIDVLHWAANAKIASLSGMEHPMVLHLHYSRIVLLVPRVALMTIAESALPVSNANETGIGYNHSPKAVEAAEHYIREWTQRDSVRFIFLQRLHPQLPVFY